MARHLFLGLLLSCGAAAAEEINSNSAFISPRQAEPDEAPGTFAPGAMEIKVSIEVAFEIE